MAAKSKAQSRMLNARFGHEWVKKHHFDNATKGLPKHAESGPLSARDMFERQWLSEGRDDLLTGKAGHVEPETKSYARMTSSDVMEQPGGTAKKWTKSLNLRKAVTNQRGIRGFTAMDKSQSTEGGKLKEALSAVQVVAALLKG